MSFTHMSLPTCIYARLERLARDKHSSLFRKLVDYVRKKFYNIGPGCNVIKLVRNLRIFIKSSSVSNLESLSSPV
jgi:hypothetical protein